MHGHKTSLQKYFISLIVAFGSFVNMTCDVDNIGSTNITPPSIDDSESGEEGETDSPAPEDVPGLVVCPPTEGSRIEFEKDSTMDNEVHARNFYDVQRGRCTIRPYTNDSGESGLVCLPLSNGGNIYFEDTNCNAPVAYFTQENYVKRYIETLARVNNNNVTRLYEVGNRLANAPSLLFELGPNGACIPRSTPDSGVFLDAPILLRFEDLVSFETSQVVAGALQQTRLHGSDGSVLCEQTNFFDSNLQNACQFIGYTNSDAISCSPTTTARIFESFQSSACESNKIFGEDGNVRADYSYGAYTRRIDECTTRREIYEVSPNTSPTFQIQDNGECVQGRWSNWSVGALVDPSLMVKASYFVNPSSTGRLRRSYQKTANGLLIDKGGWWDSKLQTPCTVGRSSSESAEKRCTPMHTGRVVSRFLDEDCENEMQVVVADACQESPLKFGYSNIDGDETFWELSPREQSTYSYSRDPDTRELGCYLIQEQTYELATAVSLESLGTVYRSIPNVEGE